MTLLEELRHDFGTHDAFLHVLLGLVSLSRRHAQELSSLPPAPLPPEPPITSEDRPVLLLLGLVSVRRTLMQALETPQGRAAAPTREAPASPLKGPPRLRDLLR